MPSYMNTLHEGSDGAMGQVSDYFKDGILIDGKIDTTDENSVAQEIDSLENGLRQNRQFVDLLTESPIFRRHTAYQQGDDDDADDDEDEVEILHISKILNKLMTLQQLVQTAFPFQQGCTVQALETSNSFTVVRQQKGKPRVVIGRIKSDTFSVTTGTETGMYNLAWLLKERHQTDDRGIVLSRYRAMKRQL